MNRCVQCGIEYEAKTARSKYCSDKCKVSAYRNKDTVTSVTVTDDNDVTVTDPNPLAILDPATNPNTTDYITLSDGQQFYPDPRPAQILDQWRQGKGTPYQQTLASHGDVIRQSAMARQQEGTINV